MKKIALIVAVGHHLAIGKNNTLPWHCPEDLAQFKQLTLHHAVIMGSKTYHAIGRPLPNRHNIIISRNRGLNIASVEVAHSFAQAVALANQHPAATDYIFVIGGAQIYSMAMPTADVLYITQIDKRVDGADAFFPRWQAGQWAACPDYSTGTHRSTNGMNYTFTKYYRV